MSRKIMVEVSEEELKSLDKVKTLDDIIEELINYLNTHKCDKSYTGYDIASRQEIIKRSYETPNASVKFDKFADGVFYVRVERKHKG